MSQRDQMPRDRFRGTEIIRLDVDKLLAKGSPLAQQDGGNALFEEILKNRSRGFHPIDRSNKNTVHTARHKTPDHRIFAIYLAQRMSQQQVEPAFIGHTLQGQQHARVDRIGWGRNDQPQEAGLAIS